MANVAELPEENKLRGETEVHLRSALFNAEQLGDDFLSYLLKMAFEQFQAGASEGKQGKRRK
ncbi:hypothetical protein [Rhizobium sp. C4]|uniref:hypothetical protein n=1 Tax=Rhizobium sp. C4 TaxID=1349800 RepID=UPI001E419C30|nr:hypothetical protein [Rhizobium sp. C4]MCD2175041.1 hypothetical protein [Rhizobium sp. C4]